ncbi:MAG TPA: hypothetical protein PLY93_02115, partial [Turneriella sp.]|nr:hypothetical protein [Turneriella sp.]
YKKMILRFGIAIVVAAWLIWQIPFSSTHEIRLPELVTFLSFENNTLAPEENPALTFYRRTEKGQYRTYGVSEAGKLVRTLDLPGHEIIRPDGTSIRMQDKEGYITGPENGAYYIWYPQLGSQVYVFNEKGAFLWEKEESHYLHTLPRGRYILAAAGDQSRMLFMNPDFKIHADFQGVLFNRFILDDNPDLKSAQICLGTLDGDVIVAHLDKKLYFRKKLGYALKSLQCDFSTSTLAAIIEERPISESKDKGAVAKDILLRAKFQLDPAEKQNTAETMTAIKANIEIQSQIDLPALTQTASPMALTENTTCFLQAEGETVQIFYTPNRRAKIVKISLSVKNKQELSADTWRSARITVDTMQSCLFAHPSGHWLLANERGLLAERFDLPSIRLLNNKSAVFMQTPTGIFKLQ